MSEATKALEKVAPFTVDKRDMSFKSKVTRDPMEPSKEVKATPSPGAYNPLLPKRDLTQSKNYQQFGSSVERKPLIGRDISA